MRHLLTIVGLTTALLAPQSGFTADPASVPEKWHTPLGLYLTPQEALAMKNGNPEAVTFIDVRTHGEIKYIGVADAMDAHVPVRMLREDYAWSKKSKTYRTRLNQDFVAAVDTLIKSRALGPDDPVILMCQSGSRVPVAAKMLHEAGYTRVYTQFEGFEGIKAKSGKDKGKRVVNGWKNAGLPWSYTLDPAEMYFNFEPGQ